MKKIILLCMLSVLSMAQGWEYLLYSTGVEFKDKKMLHYSVINENGNKASAGNGENSLIANAEMLKKYLGSWEYEKGYQMDILRILGKKGWELIAIKGEVNNSNQNMYFKRGK